MQKMGIDLRLQHPDLRLPFPHLTDILFPAQILHLFFHSAQKIPNLHHFISCIFHQIPVLLMGHLIH